MASVYDYCTPRRDADEVRVIALQPRQRDEVIIYDLLVTKLEDPSDYTALSYS